MNFCFLKLRPHSAYLLLQLVAATTRGFIGLPFLADDRKVSRPKSILAIEYLIIAAIVYFEVLTVAAFVHHALDRNIASKPAKFYLRNVQGMAMGGAIANVTLHILLAVTTRRLTGMHLAVWGTRLTLTLVLLGSLFLKSSELLAVKKSELQKYLDEDLEVVAQPTSSDAEVTATEDEVVEEEDEEEESGEEEEGEEEPNEAESPDVAVGAEA